MIRKWSIILDSGTELLSRNLLKKKTEEKYSVYQIYYYVSRFPLFVVTLFSYDVASIWKRIPN